MLLSDRQQVGYPRLGIDPISPRRISGKAWIHVLREKNSKKKILNYRYFFVALQIYLYF